MTTRESARKSARNAFASRPYAPLPSNEVNRVTAVCGRVSRSRRAQIHARKNARQKRAKSAPLRVCIAALHAATLERSQSRHGRVWPCLALATTRNFRAPKACDNAFASRPYTPLPSNEVNRVTAVCGRVSRSRRRKNSRAKARQKRAITRLHRGLTRRYPRTKSIASRPCVAVSRAHDTRKFTRAKTRAKSAPKACDNAFASRPYTPLPSNEVNRVTAVCGRVSRSRRRKNSRAKARQKRAITRLHRGLTRRYPRTKSIASRPCVAVSRARDARK
jgi:uncharacterized CHY-type Zn-finger protein